MRIVVTGGAGFVGYNLVLKLIARGDTVTVVDNMSGGAPALRRNALLGRRGVPVRTESIFTLKDELAGVSADALVHLAGPISVPDSYTNPAKYREQIAGGTAAVIETCRALGIPRIAFASTAAVYGNTPHVPVREDQLDLSLPRSPYAEAKLAAEDALKKAARENGLKAAILRLFNIYGPGQDPVSPYSGVVCKFLERVANKQQPVVHGTGMQTRDMVYVGDVADAFIAAITGPAVQELTANIGTGCETTVKELALTACAIAGVPLEPRYAEARGGDIVRSCADVGVAREKLGWTAKTALAEGLQKTLAWYRESV